MLTVFSTPNRLFKSLLVVVIGCICFTTAAQAIEKVTYFHTDALGSPAAATDATGQLLWREYYQPYGERIAFAVNNTNKAWYTGKIQHDDTGLAYYGARWYDPVVGRFMAIDPVPYKEGNLHSFNAYAYANNNPYAYIDFDGREPNWGDVGRAYVNLMILDQDSSPAPISFRAVGASLGYDVGLSYEDPSFGANLEFGYHATEAAVGLAAGGRGALKSLPKLLNSEKKLVAKSGVQILEQEDNVIIASFKVANGEARVAAEMVRDGNKLILRGAHIEGDATLKEALSAAKAYGREQGVKEIIIEGGRRTTGANPGHFPRPITIETGL